MQVESCQEEEVSQKKRHLVTLVREAWKSDPLVIGEKIAAKMAENDIIIYSLDKIVDLIHVRDLNSQGTVSFYMNRQAESKCGSILVRRSLYVLSCKDISDLLNEIKKKSPR